MTGSPDGVAACLARGLAVVQGDADRDLADFPTRGFDYAILSQTLQAVRSSERVVREMLRVGREGIVTFPNFGHWRNRLHVLRGHMPVSENIPFEWYDTPNIHLCTINDFLDLCRDAGAKVEGVGALNAYGTKLGVSLPLFMLLVTACVHQPPPRIPSKLAAVHSIAVLPFSSNSRDVGYALRDLLVTRLMTSQPCSLSAWTPSSRMTPA